MGRAGGGKTVNGYRFPFGFKCKTNHMNLIMY